MHNQKHARNYNQVLEQRVFHKEINFVLWKQGVYELDSKLFEKHLLNIEEEFEHNTVRLELFPQDNDVYA